MICFLKVPNIYNLFNKFLIQISVLKSSNVNFYQNCRNENTHKMRRLILLIWVALAAAQYEGMERQSVSFPSKSSLGPLYSAFSSGPTFRDTSYEDNAVTPTPSPTPIYRNTGIMQQVAEIIY